MYELKVHTCLYGMVSTLGFGLPYLCIVKNDLGEHGRLRLKYWNLSLLRLEKSSTIYRVVAYVKQISISKHFEIQGPVNTEDLFV